MWELRHKSLTSKEVVSFDYAAHQLGVQDQVDEIDKATKDLASDEYVKWLEDHPYAKEF